MQRALDGDRLTPVLVAASRALSCVRLRAKAHAASLQLAFAPIVGLLLGLLAITVPWGTMVLSVVLYIVIPVLIAQAVRRGLLASGGQPALDRLLARLGLVSLVALLATLVLLFGFQGEQILAQPAVIGLLAVPILI